MGGNNIYHDEREARLPQWAQRHINMLREKIAEANDRAEQVHTPDKSRVRWGDDDAYRARKAVGIPEGAPVTFQLSRGVAVQCRLDEDRLHVWLSGRTEDLVVRPASGANTVTIAHG